MSSVKKNDNLRSSPWSGREGSRWHRLPPAVQAPASHTTPTQQQNKIKTTKSTQRSQQTIFKGKHLIFSLEVFTFTNLN